MGRPHVDDSRATTGAAKGGDPRPRRSQLPINDSE